ISFTTVARHFEKAALQRFAFTCHCTRHSQMAGGNALNCTIKARSGNICVKKKLRVFGQSENMGRRFRI
ncbi:MAG: hypothetical protein ACKPJD_32305, partial [Planctomycetaceae bacterium]